MSTPQNPDDILQQQLVELLTALRKPETIPVEVGIHIERETGASERPCLVALCTGGQFLHPRLYRTTLTLRGRTRPLQPAAPLEEGAPEVTPDPTAATLEASTWHAAAVQLLMDNLPALYDRLAVTGFRVRGLLKKAAANAPDTDNGWQYDQSFQVDLQAAPVS